MDVDGVPKEKCRGKLYILSEDSAWQEAGIGHASIVGAGTHRRLQFKAEDSGKILHDRPVFASDVYQLQGEGERKTIIVWEDQEDQKDWALSFQDDDGSQAIYRLICHEPGEVVKLLPPPKLTNLQDLAPRIALVNPSQREGVALELQEEEFISELRESFHSAEDLNSAKDLTCIFQIVKRIFLMSTHALTERYLAEDVYEDVLGMLENDDSLPVEKRIPHRQVMREKVTFNDVLSFEDVETLKRIHLNYRLLYLKDIVLPRALDDGAFASLQQLIHKNLAAILEHLQKSDQVLTRLMEQVRQQDMQSLLFLEDACRLSRQIAPEQRQALYSKMATAGLFDALAVYFTGEWPREAQATGEELAVRKPAEHPAQHHAVEVLLLHATFHPMLLRNWLTKEKNEDGRRVLRDLTHMMVQETDQGVQGQIAEILRWILDPATLEHKEQDKRLDVFYEQGAMDDILSPLREPPKVGTPPQVCFALQLICEIAAFAVAKHGYRAKVYVIRHGLGQQVCRLLSAPQRYLQLAAVRVLRAIVGTKDEAYVRYVSKNNLLSLLLQSFEKSIMPPALGTNLMASATLELVEFIRQQNLKVLVETICKNHAPLLQRYGDRMKPLEQLLLKYQQNLEVEQYPPEQHASGAPQDAAGSRAQRRTRSPGRDESGEDESYFESLDEEESPNGKETSDLPGLLGGYADEDKEETPAETAPQSTAHVSKKLRTAEPDEAKSSDET